MHVDHCTFARLLVSVRWILDIAKCPLQTKDSLCPVPFALPGLVPEESSTSLGQSPAHWKTLHGRPGECSRERERERERKKKRNAAEKKRERERERGGAAVEAATAGCWKKTVSLSHKAEEENVAGETGLSVPKSRESLRLRQRILPLPRKIARVLRPQDVRCSCDQKSLVNSDFLCDESDKNDSHYGMPCDSRICGENSLANGDTRFWCTQDREHCLIPNFVLWKSPCKTSGQSTFGKGPSCEVPNSKWDSIANGVCRKGFAWVVSSFVLRILDVRVLLGLEHSFGEWQNFFLVWSAHLVNARLPLLGVHILWILQAAPFYETGLLTLSNV